MRKNKHLHGHRVTTGKYYSISSYGIIKEGDVLDHLKKLKNDTFNGAIADPPYNIGKNFGNSSDNMPLENYIEWSKIWINELLRIVRVGAPVFVYGFAEILARIAANYPIDKQRWLVWHYTNKTVPSSRFWQRSHESILCLWRGKRRNIASLNDLREPYTESFVSCAGKIRKDTEGRYGKGRKTIYNAHPKGALPRDVIKIPALAGGAGMTERWFLCKNCKSVLPPPS